MNKLIYFSRLYHLKVLLKFVSESRKDVPKGRGGVGGCLTEEA